MTKPDELKIRPTVLLPLRRAASFLEVYAENGRGEVMVPLSTNLAVGEPCELEIAFAAEKMIIHTRGTARWKRIKAQPSLPPGVGIELAPGEERTRELLLDFAHGRATAMVRRNSRRFLVNIDVEYAVATRVATGLTDDLSLGGCFVLTSEPPDIGEIVTLKLKPPGFVFGIALNGEVAWTNHGPRPGFGVQFSRLKKNALARLEELITRIREQVAANA